MNVAFGDHQVTIYQGRDGADDRRRRPPCGPLSRLLARHRRALGRCPRPPPYENVPNRSGQDPHGAPRATPAEQQLVSDFFDGAILHRDDCGGGPCNSVGFLGQ
ncbi:MAG TPA: hypothetical protein VFT79_08790 [Solirubrobacterales bacterium]|nr:hypothetical protein [Solirubrobacterales bacterium]